MSFFYDKKETYTQEEVDNLLAQHKNFVNKEFSKTNESEVKKIKDELEKVKQELIPYKQNEKTNHLLELGKDLTSEKQLKAAIKLADIKDDYDDEKIIQVITNVIKENDFLQSNPKLPNEGSKIVKQQVKPNPKSTKGDDIAEHKKSLKIVHSIL